MFDKDTAINDNLEATLLRDGDRLIVDDTKLKPDRLRANGDRLAGNGRRRLSRAKDINNVHWEGDGAEGGIACLVENLARIGVHRHDAIALRLHIARDRVARAFGVG